MRVRTAPHPSIHEPARQGQEPTDCGCLELPIPDLASWSGCGSMDQPPVELRSVSLADIGGSASEDVGAEEAPSIVSGLLLRLFGEGSSLLLRRLPLPSMRLLLGSRLRSSLSRGCPRLRLRGRLLLRSFLSS